MFDRNIIFRALLTALFFALPGLVRAEIEVTEIAWMGTTASANDEWIEIHNSGSETVSLSGWSLVASDGTPSITLSGSIGVGEYKLLERTDDTTYPGISALVIFTGALGNEGESLTLRDGNSTVQSMAFSGGWPAGDITTKKTMQWTGSAWITAEGTAGGATTATVSEEVEEDDEEENEGNTGDEEEDQEDEEESTETELGSHTAPKRTVYDDMIFELDFPSRAIAGNPERFSAQALDFDRTKLRKGKFIFNMGDGTVRTFSKEWNGKGAGFFFHTYDHPGTYQVTIRYYMTVFEDVPPEVEDTWTIEVSAPNISISKVLFDGSIEMKNLSSSTVDISKWVLKSDSVRLFEIPEGSVVLGGKTVVFDSDMTHFNSGDNITLLTPTGAYVASSIPTKPVLIKKASMESEEKELSGEVLGAATALSSGIPASQIAETKEKPETLVWVLLFIILVLVSVIAVLFLKREEHKEEYLLLDE